MFSELILRNPQDTLRLSLENPKVYQGLPSLSQENSKVTLRKPMYYYDWLASHHPISTNHSTVKYV